MQVVGSNLASFFDKISGNFKFLLKLILNKFRLNEGFATWGEFLLPELLDITIDMEFHHLFNIKKTQNALRYDSRQSTRPMTFPTSTIAEISARFDNIAYDKCEYIK